MNLQLRERVRRSAWVAAAAFMGAGVALALRADSVPSLGLLQGARLLSITTDARPEGSSAAYASSRFTYVSPFNSSALLRRAKEEFPASLPRWADDGSPVLVIPRVEDGRVQVTYPPQRTLVFQSAEGYTKIDVYEYRRPSALTGVISWIRGAIPI